MLGVLRSQAAAMIASRLYEDVAIEGSDVFLRGNATPQPRWWASSKP